MKGEIQLLIDWLNSGIAIGQRKELGEILPLTVESWKTS